MTLTDELRMAEDFDRAFARRAPHIVLRAKTEADQVFLSDLFVLCLPLRDALPPEMLSMQWRLQYASHRNAHPLAMRRIALIDGAPVGRFMVDWTPADRSQGVDLAVEPERRDSGAALALLRSWVEVADAWGKPCRLSVLATNPARRIYERLGFRADLDPPEEAPVLFMARPVALARKAYQPSES